MGTVHQFFPAAAEPFGAHSSRRSMFMRAALRIVGSDRPHSLKVTEVSSTEIRGSTSVGLFVGSRVEIEMRNLSTIAGQVLEIRDGNRITIRLDRVIDPDLLQFPVIGSYGAPPTPTPAPALLGPLHMV